MSKKKSLTMREWSDEDQPREKLLSKGKKELTNAELIAILLRSGVAGRSAINLAQEVLNQCNDSLTQLSLLDAKTLGKIKGMGTAKTTGLIAALELGRRMQGEKEGGRVRHIGNSTDLFALMAPIVADLKHEEFWVVYLNNSHNVLGKQRIASGGMTSTTVDMRTLFSAILDRQATGIALVHNHPSGNVQPSASDEKLTRQIIEAGKVLQINIIDHIIIGLNTANQPHYFSFIDSAML